jgi:hypothetical protein
VVPFFDFLLHSIRNVFRGKPTPSLIHPGESVPQEYAALTQEKGEMARKMDKEWAKSRAQKIDSLT